MSKQYCDRKTLLREIQSSQQAEKLNDFVGRAIMQLAENFAKKSNWRGYSYREDMIAQAVMVMCTAAMKFDPAKSDNPFGYLTTCAQNAFLKVLSQEKTVVRAREALVGERLAGGDFSPVRLAAINREMVGEQTVATDAALSHLWIGPVPVAEWRPIAAQAGYSVSQTGDVRRDEIIVERAGGGWKSIQAVILRREGWGHDFVAIKREESRERVRWRDLARAAWPGVDFGEDRPARSSKRDFQATIASDDFRPIRDGRYLVSRDGRVIRCARRNDAGIKITEMMMSSNGAARSVVLDGRRICMNKIIREAWPDFVPVENRGRPRKA